jgi:hypothetical protein
LTNQLPAHLQKYQARDIGTTALANLGSSMPPHVSIGNNRFTLIDAANNEIPVPTFDPRLGPYLDAAIIDVADVMSRIFYDGPYDSTAEGKRPDCFSDNGIGPSMSASAPQAPTCAACPKSEWTKVNPNGNKVPWCTQKYKVALVIPGFDTVFLLAVPPASHGPLREYMATCKGNNALASNLITRISFAKQGILQFQPLSWIDEAVAQLRERAYAEKKTDSLVGRLDMPRPAGTIAAIQPVQQNSALTAITTQPEQTGWPQGHHPTTQASPNPGGTPFAPLMQQTVQNWPQGQQAAPQTQQVQQPGPFAPTPAQNAANPGWPPQNPAPTAATTSPSDPAPTRRKRRTQAEIVADKIAAANGAQQPAGAQQAPFPHPGQQTVQQSQASPAGAFPQSSSPAALPGQLEFGIGQGQPADDNSEVKNTLDSFFRDQP